MSESIFATMKELTRNKGRIVMASVHTPSSEMCQQFTHVLLLTCDGRLAYHGRQDQAIKYFHGLGCVHGIGHMGARSWWVGGRCLGGIPICRRLGDLLTPI